MIPEKHQEFIDRAVGILKRDPRIAGIALTGSYVTGNMDEFSDLDFMVFVEPHYFEQFLSERRDLIGRIGGLLSAFTGDHIGVPDLLICLFESPLMHADFNFLQLEMAVRRVYHAAVLYDKNGVLTKAQENAEVFEPRFDPQWLEDRFWVWVHYAALKIGRGELFEALDMITYLRATVLGPLLHVKYGGQPRGVRRLERVAPEYLRQLEKTVPVYDACSCIRALKEEIGLYRALREPYLDGIIRRDKAEAAAENYLDEIMDLFLDCDTGDQD